MQVSRCLVVASWVGLVAVAGCQQGSEPLGQGEEAVISDGVHSQGNPRFLFLPPMVAMPTVRGLPDPAANPVVRIDEIDPASGERGAPVARFTMNSGPGSETVRYDATSGGYLVNWHTDAFALDPAKTYRIAVRAGDEVLGFADVDVVGAAKELRNVNTDEYIPLLDDRTLPIKFRIAVDGDGDGVADFMDDCVDVANRDQADGDGDHAGDACEARVAHHRLTREILLGSEDADAHLALGIAARPGEGVALSIDWGDGSSTQQAGLADRAQVTVDHTYASTGRFAVSATTCAATGGCNQAPLGGVAVITDKADTPLVAFGIDNSPADQQVAEQLAANPLRELSDAHGIDAASLGDSRTECTPDSQCHVKVGQVEGGVKVFGAEGIVHFNRDGSLQTITDGLADVGPVDTTPAITAAQAIATAVAQLPRCQDCLTGRPIAELMILPAGGASYLVWSIQLDRQDGTADTSRLRVFVDAHTNVIRDAYDNLQAASAPVSGTSTYYGTLNLTGFQGGAGYYLEDTGRKLGVFTYNNSTSTVSRSVDSNGVYDTAGQKAMVDAAYGATKTYDYFLNVHGRNGIDGSGGPGYYTSIDGVTRLVSSAVHYSTKYNNAFWNGSFMTYGDGDGTTFSSLTALDICGHEMTHGITERTAGLVYSGESGALNESMSDVFGAMVERYALGDSPDVWKIGERAYTPSNGTVDALRYMDNPHLAANSGFTSDDDPDHYSERYIGTGDNGGVHINSGIGNKAFYLLAQGGTHHIGHALVTGIGADAAAKIWFKALTTYMTSNTSFAGARTATLNAAAALYGTTSQQYKSTCDTWAAVGVGTGCSTTTDPPPPTGTDLIRNGGFEGSVSPWVLSTTGAFYTSNGNYPKGGTGYIYLGTTNSVIGTAYQQVTIPSGTSPTLYFSINVTSAETTTTSQYDKLFVEIRSSTGTLLSTPATYSNLNKGNAGAYAAKSVNLGAFAGQTIRVQFRATTDSSQVTTFRIDSVSTLSSTTNGFGTVEPPAIECGGAGQPPCDCADASCESCGDTTSDVGNCGGCGNVCTAGAHQTPTCEAGLCGAACEDGYSDCDGDPQNGCETGLVDNPFSCGACGTVCMSPAGEVGTCSGRVCVYGCAAGTADCDADPVNGCEVMLDTPSDCGACGHSCQAPFALPSCELGTCGIAACISGHNDCDGNPQNGCETGGACPTCPVGLVARPSWYESSPGVALAAAGTVRASLTFRRAGQTFPAVPIQVWAVPSVIEPPFSASVQYDAAGSDTFTIAVSVDVHNLPATDTVLAFRPVTDQLGTAPPTEVPLVSAVFACGGGQ